MTEPEKQEEHDVTTLAKRMSELEKNFNSFIEKANEKTVDDDGIKCSFCQNTLPRTDEPDAKRIIQGPEGNICEDCVASCHEILCPQMPTIKCGSDLECPHCQTNWAKTEEAKCSNCNQKFLIEF